MSNELENALRCYLDWRNAFQEIFNRYANSYVHQVILPKWRDNRPIHHEVAWEHGEGYQRVYICAIAGYTDPKHCLKVGDFLYDPSIRIDPRKDTFQIGVMEHTPLQACQPGTIPPAAHDPYKMLTFRRTDLGFRDRIFQGYWQRV